MFIFEAVNFAIPVVYVISFILSFLAVALILRLSHRYKWYDHVNDRKIHDGDIPRLGGIGFAAAFFIVVVAIFLVYREAEANLHNLLILFALLFILVFGIIDDFRPIKPHYKLFVQIIAAVLVIIPGFIFRRIGYFSIGVFPELLGYAITLFWFVGITNAINLIDGLDGLAGGISCLIALFFGLIFFYYGNNLIFVLFCTALVGVISGFLIFNVPFPKAKIFMGDCGSQFLGFSLALLPLLELQNSPTALPLPYAAALFLIPIFDTIAAVWRRIRDGISIHTPDKSHVHHKLINLGLSVRLVNVILCGLQIILGVLVFISIRLEGVLSLYVLGVAYLKVIIFFTTVHYMNRALQKNKKL